MKVIESPQALPGQCRFCGHAQRGPYLDTEISEEFYGAWIICKECFAGAAHMMGYFPLEKTAELQKRVEENDLTITDLQIRLDAAMRAIGDIQVASTGYQNILRIEDGSSIEFGVRNTSPELDSVRTSPENTPETFSEGTEQLVSGTGEDSESTNDEGVEQLHSASNKSASFKFNF